MNCTSVNIETIVDVVNVEILKAWVKTGTVGTMTLKLSVMKKVTAVRIVILCGRLWSRGTWLCMSGEFMFG